MPARSMSWLISKNSCKTYFLYWPMVLGMTFPVSNFLFSVTGHYSNVAKEADILDRCGSPLKGGLTWGCLTLRYMSLVMRKPAFSICENKDADQLRSNCAADQRLCFRIWIEQSLYYLNPKFKASSYLLWLYSLVCVGPGQKPRRPGFSQRGSYGKIVRCRLNL